jgi:nicotinate-nucleotide adenylyltransferase
MRIGLYFGSFNPIHLGHIQLAKQALLQGKLDKIWLIVSPQNPFKETHQLASEHHRVAMAQLACAQEAAIEVNTIELELPRPSYTIHTLRTLLQQHPETRFYLIIGEDNLPSFPLWKDYTAILSLVELLVYPRSETPQDLPTNLTPFHDRIHRLKGELLPVSATEIRSSIAEGQSVSGKVNPAVLDYIEKHHLYL